MIIVIRKIDKQSSEEWGCKVIVLFPLILFSRKNLLLEILLKFIFLYENELFL